MMDAEEIAKGLSAAQRKALVEAKDIGFNALVTFINGATASALHRKGLTLLKWCPSCLTPLGLAVRAILKGES